MKQFVTIAVLFLVSLVAQSRAELVVCGADRSPWYWAKTGKCTEIIEDNRDNTDLAPVIDGRAILIQDNNNCAIFTYGGGVTRKELALQAQVIVNRCSQNGYVTGQMNGPTPNPVCIVVKGRYVIFPFGFNGMAETLVRSEGYPEAHCFR